MKHGFNGMDLWKKEWRSINLPRSQHWTEQLLRNSLSPKAKSYLTHVRKLGRNMQTNLLLDITPPKLTYPLKRCWLVQITFLLKWFLFRWHSLIFGVRALVGWLQVIASLRKISLYKGNSWTVDKAPHFFCWDGMSPTPFLAFSWMGWNVEKTQKLDFHCCIHADGFLLAGQTWIHFTSLISLTQHSSAFSKKTHPQKNTSWTLLKMHFEVIPSKRPFETLFRGNSIKFSDKFSIPSQSPKTIW